MTEAGIAELGGSLLGGGGEPLTVDALIDRLPATLGKMVRH